MVPWCFGKTATNSNLRGSKGYDSYLSKGEMDGFLDMSFGFAMWVLRENRVNKWNLDLNLNDLAKNR